MEFFKTKKSFFISVGFEIDVGKYVSEKRGLLRKKPLFFERGLSFIRVWNYFMKIWLFPPSFTWLSVSR